MRKLLLPAMKKKKKLSDPNQLKFYVHTKICMQMSIAALFIIAKAWEQPRCPSVVNKLLYIHTREYYSEKKRNELSHHEKTWRSLKCILLSERSQSENATDCMIPTKWHSEKGKTTETVRRPMVAWDCGGGGMNRQSTEDSQGSETTLYEAVTVDTCHYTFIKTQRTYNTKIVNSNNVSIMAHQF